MADSAQNNTEAQVADVDAVKAEAGSEEEQVSRIAAAIARARSALEEVRAKVGEYDEHYKASETASAYLSTPIQKAQTAFDELATTASTLKDKTVEVPTKALSKALTTANGALEQISELAAKYDDKFKLSSTVQKAVTLPREKCTAALAEVSGLAASVSAAANAQLQGVNQGITSRASALASSSASLIFSTAAALEDRLNIESKAVSAGTAVVDRAQKLDERYNVKEKVGSLASKGLEKAQGLDERVAGGRVTPLVQSAYEKGLMMVTGGFGFVQAGYESAKQQRHQNEAEGDADKQPLVEPLLAPNEKEPAAVASNATEPATVASNATEPAAVASNATDPAAVASKATEPAGESPEK